MSLEIEANPYQSTDEHLLTLVALQDVTAYEILYDRHAATIHSLIRRVVVDPLVAEELLHDVFWQIWCTAEQFDNSCAARTWMFRIGRNRCLDELRLRKVRPQVGERTNMHQSERFQSGEQASVESEAEYQLNRRDMKTATADLPPEQRICVELAYFDGLSHQELVDKLKIPAGTVKSRLRIGMEKLERSLRRVGYP